ncbi:hypothetical protein ACW73L_07315 [Methylolobus aquaticus]
MTHTELISRTEHLLMMLKVHQQLVPDHAPPRALCRAIRRIDDMALETVRSAAAAVAAREASGETCQLPPVPSSSSLVATRRGPAGHLLGA